MADTAGGSVGRAFGRDVDMPVHAALSRDDGDRWTGSGHDVAPAAVIQPALVALTGNAQIDGLLWGWQWGDTDLTFRFPGSANEYLAQFPGGPGYQGVSGFQPFSNFQANQIVNFGLSNLSLFSGLTFTHDANFGGGNLRFAIADTIWYENGHGTPGPHGPGGGRSAEGNPPDPTFSTFSAMGDTWYIAGSYANPVLGSFSYSAGLLHEVGHALGLKHGHHTQPRNDGQGGQVTLPTLPGNVDSQEFSIMTYRSYIGHDVQNVGASGQEEYPWTYMMLDLQALQYMYGANFGPGSNEGDSVYSFDAATGEMTIGGNSFGASYHAKVLLTIWDGGGEDTYDFSNHGSDQTISLVPGGWTTFNPAQLANLSLGQQGNPVNLARGNVANALQYQGDLRSLIENAKGGTGDDKITGNVVANDLYGGGGGDSLYGGDGNDLLNTGAGSDRGYGGTGKDRLLGSSGNDFLKGGDAADTIRGGTGGDSLYGEAGNDLLEGEDGADFLSGADGNDRIFGGAANDDLRGAIGDDTLDGGADDDRLTGSLGADRQTGGTGADTFIFLTADSGVSATTRDTVTDFRRADGDQLDLSGIDGNAVANGVQALTFIGRDVAFTGAKGEVRFDSAQHWLEINTDNDLAAEIRVVLSGVNNVGLPDLML
jgi:serralysin